MTLTEFWHLSNVKLSLGNAWKKNTFQTKYFPLSNIFFYLDKDAIFCENIYLGNTVYYQIMQLHHTRPPNSLGKQVCVLMKNYIVHKRSSLVMFLTTFTPWFSPNRTQTMSVKWYHISNSLSRFFFWLLMCCNMPLNIGM